MSRRQMGTAVFVALLAPAAALTGVLARVGGAVGWLGPVLALAAVVPAALCLRRLEGRSLSRALGERLGLPGRLLGAVYYLWVTALAAMTAGGGVDRLSRTDYGSLPAWVTALALALTAGYLIRRGAAAFGRSTEIFWLVFALLLAGLFLLGAANLRRENLTPTWETGGEAVKGVLPTLGTVSVGAVALLAPRASEEAGGGGWRWPAGWCLTAAGLCLLTVGALGAPITARGPLPFFLALQGLGVEGGFQRLEALGTAAWALSDLTLIGLAALAGQELTGSRRWGAWPVLGAAFLGGCLLTDAAMERAAGWMYAVDLVLGGGVPVVVSLLPGGGRVSKKETQ